MTATNLIALAASTLLFTAASHAVTIDLVTIGNPGNASDATGYGAVGYFYQIGKYEVTAGQYTEFLNAVAKADPNELYAPSMGDSNGWVGANIQRRGTSPNYSYDVPADWANRPVNNVSFWDAARFANWLHNGQPTGPQGPGTTEDGAYLNIGNQDTFTRQPGARFVIPTESEWYKAAYHQNDGVAGNYSYYASTIGSPPMNTLPDPGGHANFYNIFLAASGGYTIGFPYFRTEVGEFANTASAYGTFDQGGNVAEWNETSVNGTSRLLRGGSFTSLSTNLRASFRYNGSAPAGEYGYVGFRIASLIPEPSSIVIATMSGLVLCLGTRCRS